jgi:hypothetical protein
MQNNGLFFSKNLDKCFSIDKTSLSNGELYVFRIRNKTWGVIRK